MSSNTPEGFRREFMAKTALGLMQGGAVGEIESETDQVWLKNSTMGPILFFKVPLTNVDDFNQFVYPEPAQMMSNRTTDFPVLTDETLQQANRNITNNEIQSIVNWIKEDTTQLELYMKLEFVLCAVTYEMIKDVCQLRFVHGFLAFKWLFWKSYQVESELTKNNALTFVKGLVYGFNIGCRGKELSPLEKFITQETEKASVSNYRTTNPFLASYILFKVGYDKIDNSEFQHTALDAPMVTHLATEGSVAPQTIVDVVNALVDTANVCKGAINFVNSDSRLRHYRNPSWIKHEISSRWTSERLPEGVERMSKAEADALRVALADKSSAAAIDAAAALKLVSPLDASVVNSVGPVVLIPRLKGGSSAGIVEGQSMADVYDRLLKLQVSQLAEKQKKLSDHSMSKLNSLIDNYRSLEEKILSTDAKLVGGANTEELLNERNELDVEKNKHTIRLNDIFRSLQGASQSV